MWNEAFERLRKRLTIIYTLVFSAIIVAIIAAAYIFIWWEIFNHEKSDLVAQVYHEAEEWLNSGEMPCSQIELRDGIMLAYFVTMDDKNVIINQLGDGPQGKAIFSHKGDWPRVMESTRLLRMHGDGEARYRYLAAVAPVAKGNAVIGKLYMFKNIEFYYAAAYKTLFLLICVALVLVLGACYVSYYIAGINIRPIKQMYEQQKQFTADASHEMRTPLAVMRLAVTALQEDNDSSYSSFARDSLTMLSSEVDSMSRLTTRLMELARSEQEEEPLAVERLPFSTMCENVGAQLELLAAQRGIELQRLVEPGIYLRGDADGLKRLLIILLDNAIKYSEEKSKIILRIYEDKGSVHLLVADEGEGISEENKQRVFDRFYRVDKARSRSQGGFGLGLSMAQSIVRQHGATISIEDNVPKGTIIRVVFDTKKLK